MTTFHHNGKHGDLIYSLPTIRALGGGVLYIPQDTLDNVSGMYDNLRPLLELQPYINEVRQYPSNLAYMQLAPGIHIDYDLDRARMEKAKGVKHIIRWYMDAFDVNIPHWKEPWLTVPDVTPGDYTVINYTGRHITNDQTGETSKVNWKKVVAGISGQPVFVGLVDEYLNFLKLINDDHGHLPFVQCKDALQLARVIKGARACYVNQSFVLTLCQALGVPYWLDVKPGKSNTIMRTKNENIL